MPIYEYVCDYCGHHKEVFQGMNDAPLMDCDNCGKPGLKKQVSAAGFRLKGSGWYETDFKTDDKKKNLVTNEESHSSNSSSSSSSNASSSTKDTKNPKESSNTNTNKNEASKSETKKETSTETKPKENISKSKPEDS